MSTRLTFQITDVPDREKLVAELWCDEGMWGEISQEGEQITLEVYPKQNGEPWRLSAQAVEQILRAARGALTGITTDDEVA